MPSSRHQTSQSIAHLVGNQTTERRIRGARLNAVVESNTTSRDTTFVQGTITGQDEVITLLTFRCPWCKESYSSSNAYDVRLAAAHHVRQTTCKERLG
jgi:hypothetical protein